MDRVIDDYTEIATELEDDVLNIETKVFSGKRWTVSQDIYFLKREVIEYRHAIEPLIVPLQKLADETSETITDYLKPFSAIRSITSCAPPNMHRGWILS